MEKETASFFEGKYVKIERLRLSDSRPFKLFGTIEKVTKDSILLRSKTKLGAIRLVDVISITEWRD